MRNSAEWDKNGLQQDNAYWSELEANLAGFRSCSHTRGGVGGGAGTARPQSLPRFSFTG